MNAPVKLALMLAAAAISLPQAATASPTIAKVWEGTWQLNSDKSHFASADTTPKSETRTYTVSGNRVTMRSTLVNAAGKTMNWSYSAAINGKPGRVVGNPNVDHLSLRQTGAREIKSQSTRHGKLAVRSTATVSDDGKMLTVHRTMLLTKGGPSEETSVYDRTK